MASSARDVIIRGGEVIDGSGAPAFAADVRVRDGRIAEIGAGLRPDGEREIDASGAVVTPGFIDTHAHTDPQVFWDASLDPEPLHGVTTMLVGNCSLSLFPVNDSTRSDVSDLFAYIEDVPRHLFDDSVPWTWSDYAGYRDAVDASGVGTNIAALMGHSPLRLTVMGQDAWTRAATPDEIEAMAAVLDVAMQQGAWGLSTSFLDVDMHGRPVPSRAAENDEFEALFDAIGRSGRGLVEMVPGLLQGSPEVRLTELSRRCGERGIPLTWTGFTHSDSNPAATQRWIDLASELAADGARMYPQLSPRTVDFRLNWDSSMMFMSMPEGWHRIVAARGDDKRALLLDPVWRAAARDEWDRTERALFPHRRPETVRFVEVHGAENQRWLGMTLADLIAERGGHPSDVLADFVVANDCHPGVVAVGVANADIDGVARTLTDPAVIISSSDAGAHAQMLCASGDSTLLFTRHVRERNDLSLERAVHELTGRQASIFGFSGRGTVSVGAIADLAVFALDELHYDDDVFVHDLPGGGARLRRGEGGYRATIVDGTPVQLGGVMTGALPGRVISSAA
ncbi:MAG: Amidohydrolase 3 [Ilumatobacteraceae bacterium]|nr:Amidohydrolase 3 [Ilumatobacteraceae bacterium]